MAKYRIAWLPGDGIGVGIIDAGGLIPYTRNRLLQTIANK